MEWMAADACTDALAVAVAVVDGGSG